MVLHQMVLHQIVLHQIVLHQILLTPPNSTPPNILQSHLDKYGILVYSIIYKYNSNYRLQNYQQLQSIIYLIRHT